MYGPQPIKDYLRRQNAASPYAGMPDDIRERLEAQRDQRPWTTLSDLARATDIRYGYLSQIVNGFVLPSQRIRDVLVEHMHKVLYGQPLSKLPEDQQEKRYHTVLGQLFSQPALEKTLGETFYDHTGMRSSMTQATINAVYDFLIWCSEHEMPAIREIFPAWCRQHHVDYALMRTAADSSQKWGWYVRQARNAREAANLSSS